MRKLVFGLCLICLSARAADLITAQEATDIAEGVVAEVSADNKGRKLPRYLGAFAFEDTYEEDAAWYYERLESFGGACSARRIGSEIERNYDWLYDEAATFVVSVTASDARFASIGVASVGTRITADDLKARTWSRYWRCLPGATLDGVNSCGVAAEVNVVTTNGAPWETKGERDINALGAVRWVLDKASSAAVAASNLALRVYIPEAMTRRGYSAHFAVCDADETWVVEDGVATLRPGGVPQVLTNFRVLNPTEPYGTGYERYAMLTNEANAITSAWFRAAYRRPFSRPTEFAKPGVGTHDETAALLAWAEANIPQGAPETLERGGGSWQTVHTSVYDVTNHTLRIAVQEVDDWYTFAVPVAGGVKPEAVREIVQPMLEPVSNIAVSAQQTASAAQTAASTAQQTADEATRLVGSLADDVAAVAIAATNYTDDAIAGANHVPYVMDVNSNYTAVTIGTREEGSIVGEYSFAQGIDVAASGMESHAEGVGAHAEGVGTHAEGYCSHAEGEGSHAEGDNTHAECECSHAEGYSTHAEGNYAHAEGYCSHAEGEGSHAEGYYTHAEGECSFVYSGYRTTKYGSLTRWYEGNSVRTNTMVVYRGYIYRVCHETGFPDVLPKRGRTNAWWEAVWDADLGRWATLNRDHGEGTFNIHPVGGLSGFWVGETNMADHVSRAVDAKRGKTDMDVYASTQVYYVEPTAEDIYYCHFTLSDVGHDESNRWFVLTFEHGSYRHELPLSTLNLQPDEEQSITIDFNESDNPLEWSIADTGYGTGDPKIVRTGEELRVVDRLATTNDVAQIGEVAARADIHSEESGVESDVRVQIGYNATATGPAGKDAEYAGRNQSIAIGYNATATNWTSVAIGSGGWSVYTNEFGVETGRVTNAATADGREAVAIGYWAKAHGNMSTAVGKLARAHGDYSAAFGAQSVAGQHGVAIGFGADAATHGMQRAIAIGRYASANAENSVQLFTGTNDVANSIKIGNTFVWRSGHPANEDDPHFKTFTNSLFKTDPVRYNVAIGNGARIVTTNDTTKNASSVAIGRSSRVEPTYGDAQASVAIGMQAKSANISAITIGHSSSNYGKRSVAIGRDVVISNDVDQANMDAIAIGYQAQAYRQQGIAVGKTAVVNGSGAVQIGTGTNSEANSMKFRGTTVVGGDGKIPSASLGMTTLTVGGTNYTVGTATISGHTVMTLTPAP